MSLISTVPGGASACSSLDAPRRHSRLTLARPRGAYRDRRAAPQVVQPTPTGPSATVRPAGATTTFSRYLGGTYPSTVEVIRFTDGTQARTDLVRLHPSIAAYSIDYAGVAPANPSRYRDEAWASGAKAAAAGVEGEVVWILRHSFPTLTTAELSADLRAAGYPLGTADLKEHEAIAATQAAIWALTNGVALDTQPLSVPVAVSANVSLGGSCAGAVLDADDRSAWRARLVPGRETFLEFEFDGRPQLGDYTVELGPGTTAAAVGWRLQSSNDRRTWRDVSSSQVEVALLEGDREPVLARTKALGVGATFSGSAYAAGSMGYRYYRLVLRGYADADAGVEVRAVRFTLADSEGFRNGARVVHLYQYLLERATAEVLGVPRVSLSGPPVVDVAPGTGVTGPFHLDGDRPAEVWVAGAAGARVVGQDGAQLRGPARPGRPFYVELPVGEGEGAFTLTASVGPVHGYEGRALVGARSDDGPAEFTTLARAVRVSRHAVGTLHVRWRAGAVGTPLLQQVG
jgi:TQXA domain-containing protein